MTKCIGYKILPLVCICLEWIKQDSLSLFRLNFKAIIAEENRKSAGTSQLWRSFTGRVREPHTKCMGCQLCETLPKLAHLAIIPYGVRVLSGTGIKNHIVREPPPIRCCCALASASADAMLCTTLREHKLEGTQTSPPGATLFKS